MGSNAAAALVGAALLIGGSAGQEARTSDSLVRSFVSNGRIRMNLSAGDYRIVGTPADRIRVEWSVRDAAQLPRVRVGADVRGGEAALSTDSPDNSRFKVVVQVPSQADLYVRLTAGDLRVENIRGNKDIELHAGDVDIDVGRPDDYQHVDASVWAGDLTAAPFNVYKGGLFRSFDWSGKGRYRLHAKLKAGDLRLFTKSAEQ